mgnify:CR=1 FL=1
MNVVNNDDDDDDTYIVQRITTTTKKLWSNKLSQNNPKNRIMNKIDNRNEV